MMRYSSARLMGSTIERSDYMSKISATMYGQKADKRCKTCGKPIMYGINGSQMFDECMDCYKPTYHCSPTPVRREVDWNELDALEDKCLGDVID